MPVVQTSVPTHTGTTPGSTSTTIRFPVTDGGSTWGCGSRCPSKQESTVQEVDIYWCREEGITGKQAAEVTTAQAGTEPLSIDPSSQQHPACFPPARFVCCHCTSPRTQVQVGASQNRAAKSRAATPCPGLGSHPRPQIGRAWDIPAPTRVTKAALSPGQLCHTAPWLCQSTLCRGEAWMSTLEGCRGPPPSAEPRGAPALAWLCQ